jgi:hypothetical protein
VVGGQIGPWPIVFNTYETPLGPGDHADVMEALGAGVFRTTVMSEFENARAVRFQMVRESLVQRIKSDILRRVDVQTGNPVLDSGFIIRGDNPKKVAQVLTDEAVAPCLVRLAAIKSFGSLGVFKVNHADRIVLEVLNVPASVEEL